MHSQSVVPGKLKCNWNSCLYYRLLNISTFQRLGWSYFPGSKRRESPFLKIKNDFYLYIKKKKINCVLDFLHIFGLNLGLIVSFCDGAVCWKLLLSKFLLNWIKFFFLCWYLSLILRNRTCARWTGVPVSTTSMQ